MDRRKREPNEARSKLERWILENGGPGEVSRMLGVHYVTVNTWLSRRRIPSLPVAIKMIEMSNGFLSAKDILESSKEL